MPRQLSLEKQSEWKEKILQQRQSGLSIQRWCDENQIQAHVFYYWRDKLFPQASLSRSSFKELSDSKTIGIIIEYREFRIHLDKQFDASTLKRCLQALR